MADAAVAEEEEVEAVVPPIPEEEVEEELSDEELDEAQEQGEATAKAIKGPPQNKAYTLSDTK